MDLPDLPLHLMIPSRNQHSNHSTTPTPTSSTDLSNEMNLAHHPPLDAYSAMTGVVSNSTSDYTTTHISPSAHPATQNEGQGFRNNMSGYNTNQYSLLPSMMDTSCSSSMYGTEISGGSVDIARWMQIDNFAPTENEHVSKAQVKAQGILDYVGTVLPPVSEITATATAPSSSQYKRRRTKATAHSSKDEDDEAEPRRKRDITAVPQQQPHQTRVYARAIPQEIRELKDDDFEASCEWCPFYLNEPLKHFPKPWTSCTKQRAEISHIITHIVSDHGLIRGRNSKRKNQRYLTKCSSHEVEKKGKSDCLTCSRVEDWTEQELQDERHEGPAVCLRCYTELKDKRELFTHLHTPSICMYKEDLLMKAKSKTLYKVFCAENEVPKFRPPPETSAPRDGARKRNMKTGRRTTSEPSAAQANSRPAQPRAHREIRQSQSPLPSLILSPSSQQESIPDFIDDGPPNNFFSPMEPAKQLHVTQPHQNAQPAQFMHPPPRPMPSFIARQPMPSRTSDYESLDLDFGQPYQSYSTPAIRMSHCENTPPLPVVQMESQFLLPEMHIRGDKYPSSHDSGLGTEGIRSQRAFEEQPYPVDTTFNTNNNTTNNDISMNGPNFLDDAVFQDILWPSPL